jgi:ATP-dependent helicase HepA
MNRKKGGFQSDGTDEMPLHLRGQSHMQSKTSAHITTIMPGQRWVSDMETELGLGTVVRADKRRVTISFQDGACVRQYARENAPLRRVTFKPGDRIRTSNQESGIVQSVTEENGIITYITDNGDFAEPILSDAIRITAPFERLLAGQTDPNEQYALRTALLHLRNRIDQSPARGFTGPRIELIPHQLYIANEIASRYVRRVLLADEVGLGKTIEACLILHRLIVSGRTSRALIVVPESLVHIWFVELIRKFNLVFKIYDTDYFGAVYTKNEQNNPFLDEQLIITNATFLVKNKDALRCAVETTWDTLIVDEVHHIRKGSPEFDTIESLTEHSRDVLFLTATPYQGGEEHHFARLQLLDSSRYSDFQLYQNETETHRRLAAITGRLVDGNDMSESDIEFLKSRFPESADRISSHLDTLASDPPGTRQQLVAELLDRHGIGRAMFRNTRMAMGGFPSREVRFVPCNASEAITDKVCTLFVYDSKEKKPGPKIGRASCRERV